MSGTNSFYYFLKFLEKKLKGHFNFENIKTQNVESVFFFNSLVLLLLRDTFVQFLYVLQYFFLQGEYVILDPLYIGAFRFLVCFLLLQLLLSLLLNVFWLCFLHLNDPKGRLMKEDYRRLY